jgi:hypothetical protein
MQHNHGWQDHDSSPGSAAGSIISPSQVLKSSSESDSESPVPQHPLPLVCDPSTHKMCCGVELDVRTNSWTPCQKRSTFATKVHPRGVICVSALDPAKVAKCASCSNYAHADCFILQAIGGVLQASCHQTWICNTCQQASKLEESAKTTKKETDSSTAVHHTLMIKSEILKHASDANWKCRSSQDTRMYFECLMGTCSVKFSAKNQSDDMSEYGGEWVIKNAPTAHTCGGSIRHFSSVIRKQNILSDVVFKDIQRLACSACFKSTAIQNFVRTVHSVHVHVKLIANIGYRAREKLFGGRGDMEELLKQQKVAYSFL